jgi:MAF protein
MVIGEKTIEGNDVRWILASSSPRRRELWSLVGWNAEVRPTSVSEMQEEGEKPEIYVSRLALEKARAAANAEKGNGMIFAADTIVVDGDQILGKPSDTDQARRMLLKLRGRVHCVITAIALIDLASERIFMDTCETDVPMRSYPSKSVEAYIASGSPLDKAGAYGIQDDDFDPVDEAKMEGCYANVMGLPLCHLMRGMREMGIEPPEALPGKCQAYTGYDCKIFPKVLRWEK